MDTTKIESLDASNKSPEEKYRRWKTEVEMAEKEMKDFRDAGKKVYRRYKDERDNGDEKMKKFNVFWTNVGIMQSSLFANIPKVSVERRFSQHMDDTARVASMLLNNIIMQDMDDENCDFAQVMKYAITDNLVPGLGVAWVRLETDTREETLPEVIDPLNGEVIQEESKYDMIVDQRTAMDYVHWDDYLISPCRTYEERRWEGRKVFMDRDDLKERFGEEVGKQISLDYKCEDPDSPENEIVNKAVVYEIWCRTEKMVYWLANGYPKILDEKEDPVGFEDFSPCPRPMFATQTTGNVLPKSDYSMLQDQYTELDTVNHRISLLVEACRVVGVYDSNAGPSVGRMLSETTDNTMIPVDNWAMFADKGGIKGVIDFFPLAEVMTAIEKLRQARDDIKGQIYELTGISDIVRGNTKASETLGAQQIKAQFASVRIQKRQDQVALFAQELLNLKAQIICKHYTPEQIVKQSNARFYADSMNPQIIQDAIMLIKGDTDEFNWRIKIQADSLAMADQQIMKQEKVEFINAVATFLQSMGSVVKGQPTMAPIMLETLKFAVSGFRGAQELEGIIDQTAQQAQMQMQQSQNQPPKPSPDETKVKQEMTMEQEKFKLDQAGKQQDLQYNAEKNQQDLQYQKAKNVIDLQGKVVKQQRM